MTEKKFNLSSTSDGLTRDQLKEKYQLSDAELEQASGGLRYHATSDGKYYMHDGSLSHMCDCYCCPKCKAPMTMFVLGLYGCLRCGGTYWDESKLSDNLNFQAGCWREITKEQYESYMKKERNVGYGFNV